MTKVEMTLPETKTIKRYWYHPETTYVYARCCLAGQWAAINTQGGGFTTWNGIYSSKAAATEGLLPCPPGTKITITVE